MDILGVVTDNVLLLSFAVCKYFTDMKAEFDVVCIRVYVITLICTNVDV
jgi:hypothetical protein